MKFGYLPGLALLVGLVVFQSSWALAAQSVSVRSYGEASTLEGEGGNASMLSLKAVRALPLDFSLYGGVQFERYAPTVGGIERISPLIGIERSFGPIHPFIEYRFVEEKPRTAYGKSDPRLGAFSGYWQETPFSKSEWSLISDSYGELIAIPRIRWSPTLVAFSKLGFRRPLSTSVAFDPYLEAYVRESADPAFGRPALEARYGARLIFSRNTWSLNLSIFRRFLTLRDAPESRWRALFAVGGSF